MEILKKEIQINGNLEKKFGKWKFGKNRNWGKRKFGKT